MYQSRIRINFGNLLLSMSDALELSNPLLMQHQLRTAYIAWEIAKAAGLNNEDTENLFLAALFHDIGALTPEEKAQIHQFEAENTDLHCERGATLFKQVPWLAPAAEIVRFHHRQWQQRSSNNEGSEMRNSQILMLADTLERLVNRSVYILHQHTDILDKLAQGSGECFDPELVECLKLAADREEFWLDLTSPRLYSYLLHFGPYQRKVMTVDDLAEIADVFSYIIDFRSQFTATHSAGVTECAVLLAKLFGLTEEEVKTMGIAGQLHDLGKLSIPNSILEKPSGLTREEFAIIKRHTYYTYSILNTIGGLGQIPEWAAFHHEKLDGSGYPFRMAGNNIRTGSRIMQVADIFTAMAESRPYRTHGMSKDQIVKILSDMVNHGNLDRKITGLLLNSYDDIREKVLARQIKARDFYDSHFNNKSNELDQCA